MPTLPLPLLLGPGPAALVDRALANSCSALRSRRNPPDSRRLLAALPAPSELPAPSAEADSGLAVAAPPSGAAGGGVAGSDAAYSVARRHGHKQGGRGQRACRKAGRHRSVRPTASSFPSRCQSLRHPHVHVALARPPGPSAGSPSAAEAVRDTPGDVRRRAADTEAQCTAAS